MSTITRELAKLFRKITNSEIDAEGNAHVVLSPADSLLINNARIALASLEAEPVAYMNRFTGRVFTLEEQPGADTDAQVYMPVYTTPPAPVSVPDAMEMDDDFDSAFEHGKAVGWNACRAAMLAQPVSQGYKSDGGWISCSDRLPESGQNIITLNNCGGVFGGYIFKKYTDGSYVFVDAEEEYREDDTITHWMPLPAAPQQEVNNGD
ncbi:DUF551 domain-containing protein [Enterobacter kobei]|nr:DUF551 domain-containing protein [Enterobacter kobei]